MTETTLHEQVREEIEALHRFFVEWFSGRAATTGDLFANEFEARFDDGFVLIPPAGTTLSLPALTDSIRAAHASNPAFRIAIRAVQIRRVWGSHILATYEEWQRNALASTPPDNGRVATVLFESAERLLWLHVHETWLPQRVMAAGLYDF